MVLGLVYVVGVRGVDVFFYNLVNMGFINDWDENRSEFEMIIIVINILVFKF